MKRILTVDVVAVVMGLILASVIVSVPLASAGTAGAVTRVVQDGSAAVAVSDKEDADADTGEASYNTEDCAPANEGKGTGDGVDSTDLDACEDKPK